MHLAVMTRAYVSYMAHAACCSPDLHESHEPLQSSRHSSNGYTHCLPASCTDGLLAQDLQDLLSCGPWGQGSCRDPSHGK